MTISEAIKERHAVRSYEDRPISNEILAQLNEEIAACNKESGLHIQLVTNEKKAFESMLARYGKFSNVQNYLALVGKNSPDLDKTCGYYGEHIVLAAQMMGLNTCWVAMSASKSVVKKNITIGNDDKLCIVIAIGYGTTQGTAHKSKTAAQVSEGYDDAPAWFKNGVAAALLAPTAINQQKFTFIYSNGKVSVKAGKGPYSKIDLGIAKYHFEVGAGKIK